MVGRDTPEPIRLGTPCKPSQEAVVVEPRIPPALAGGIVKEVVEEAPIGHEEMFNAWVKYAFTIVQIISQYIDSSEIFHDMTGIIQSNAKSEYNARLKAICCVLLDFANGILDKKM